MARLGQAATELIIILGVALVVVVLFFALSANMLTGTRVQQNYDDAHASVAALVEAANSVYAQGEGAVRKVAITLPSGANLDRNYTYIGAPANMSNATQNGININLNGTDMFGQTETSLVGRFPNTTGKYSMRVTSRGSYVEIYPYLVDVDKYSMTIVMAQGEVRSSSITLTRTSGETVNVTPTLNWGYNGNSTSSINLTCYWDGVNCTSLSSFPASIYGNKITFNVSSGSASAGMYNSQLTLTANGDQSGTTETINIPISVNVRT